MITGIESQADVCQLLDVFSEVWGAETLSEFVASMQSTTCLLAKTEEGDVAGYLFYGTDLREGGFVEITDVGVHGTYRGHGFGRALVRHACAQHPRVRLCVKADNHPAKALYEAQGFTVLQTVQNYYGVGHDGLRMEYSA